MVVLGCIVVGLAVFITLGWFYAILSVAVDLMAAWRETRRRVRMPRQFGLRSLFTLVTLVAVTCFFRQGAATDLAEGLAVATLSLVWAAAIIYAFHCMLSEWLRPSSQKHGCDPQSCFSDADQGINAVEGNSELDRWLAERQGDASAIDRKPASTAAVRSHFRIHLARDPKRATGFGRF